MSGQSGKRQGTREWEFTHRNIAQCALDLLTDRGVAGCDARSLAESAGVSTATLRSHYPGGKRQYLQAAASEVTVFQAADPLTGTTRERIHAYIESGLHYAPRIAVLISEAQLHSDVYPEFAAEVRRVLRTRRLNMQEFIARLGPVVRKGANVDSLLWLATGSASAAGLGDGLSSKARLMMLTDAACHLLLDG